MIVIYDGMALIHSLMKPIRNLTTFGEVANLVLTILLRLPHEVQKAIADVNQLRINIVMDRYNHCSIKDMERDHRKSRKGKAALSALPTLVTGPEQPCPSDFESFLELSSNNEQLLKFLSKEILLFSNFTLMYHQCCLSNKNSL
jgi:hypothetical protein